MEIWTLFAIAALSAATWGFRRLVAATGTTP